MTCERAERGHRSGFESCNPASFVALGFATLGSCSRWRWGEEWWGHSGRGQWVEVSEELECR